MRIQSIAIVLMLLVVASGCVAVQQARTFAQCQFAISKLDKLNMAGINVDNIKSIKELGFMQTAKIATQYASGSLPLSVTANLKIKNPNASAAALNKLDWVLAVDGADILEGTSNKRLEVAPNSSAEMPLTLAMDLRKVFKGKKLDYIKKFSSDILKNRENSKRLSIKVRPYFNILGAQLAYPGYIRLENVLKKQ